MVNASVVIDGESVERFGGEKRITVALHGDSKEEVLQLQLYEDGKFYFVLFDSDGPSDIASGNLSGKFPVVTVNHDW